MNPAGAAMRREKTKWDKATPKPGAGARGNRDTKRDTKINPEAKKETGGVTGEAEKEEAEADKRPEREREVHVASIYPAATSVGYIGSVRNNWRAL